MVWYGMVWYGVVYRTGAVMDLDGILGVSSFAGVVLSLSSKGGVYLFVSHCTIQA